MIYDEDIDPQRITLAMRVNVEALANNANNIDVLVSSIEYHVIQMQEHLESRTSMRFDDWRTIRTFLRLVQDQSEIIQQTCSNFADFKLEGRS